MDKSNSVGNNEGPTLQVSSKVSPDFHFGHQGDFLLIHVVIAVYMRGKGMIAIACSQIAVFFEIGGPSFKYLDF